jgi:hypothetical protein
MHSSRADIHSESVQNFSGKRGNAMFYQRLMSALLCAFLFLLLPAGITMMTASQAFACGGPCPEPEPEPPKEVVHEESDAYVAPVLPCSQVQAERKFYPPALEEKLVAAYKWAAKQHLWAHVWIKNGRIVALVEPGVAAPAGAVAWQLTQMPDVADDRACTKPGDGLPVIGLEWEEELTS